MTRLFIADDRDEIHQSISSLFQDEGNVEIVGHAFDGEDTLGKILQLHPDIVLLDIKMPRMSGIEVAQELTRSGYAVKIIFLTQYGEEEYVRGAMEVGAAGYVLKEQINDVIDAVHDVERGKMYLSPAVIGPFLRNSFRKSEKKSSQLASSSLNSRELEIFQYLLEGLSMESIADKMSLSRKTIEFHAANIRQKFGISELASRVA